jgi:hypothetical protein
MTRALATLASIAVFVAGCGPGARTCDQTCFASTHCDVATNLCVRDEPTAGGSAAGGSTAGGSTAGGSTAGGSTAGGSTASGSAAGGSTAGGSAAGGSTAGGSTAGGSTAGGSTAGGSTAGGSTAGGSTAGGSTAGGSTAGGSTAGGSAAGGSTAGGSTAGGSTAGGSTAGGSAGGSTAGGSTAGGSAGGSTAGGLTAGGSAAGGSTAGGSSAGSDGGAPGSVPAILWSTSEVRRDETAVALVISDEPILSSQASVWVGFFPTAPTPITACSSAGLACPNGRHCQCFELDASSLPIQGLTATWETSFIVTRDGGVEQRDGGPLSATRIRWRIDAGIQSQFQSTKSPALGADGTIYVPRQAAVRVISSTGAVLGSVTSGGRYGHVALARNSNQEVFCSVWGGGASGSIECYSTTTRQLVGTADAFGTRGQPIAPVIAMLDGGTSVVTTAFAEENFVTSVPAHLLVYSFDGVRRYDGAVTSSSANFVGQGSDVWIPSRQGNEPAVISTNLHNPTFTNISSAPDAGPINGMALTGSGPIISADYLWRYGPFAVNTQVVRPTVPVIRASGELILGAGNSLFSLATATATPVSIRTATSQFSTSPVLGRARGALPSLGYAVTDTAEVVVFRDTGYLYSIQLPQFGRPSHPVLDCNRANPNSGTGILYIAFESGAVVALIVDSPGLDPTSPWPKYQRTAGNHGNAAAVFPLNDGCPP